MSDILQRATDALRAETAGPDPRQDHATRLRLRRSLEERARGRRRLALVGALAAFLFGGTTAWAIATGELARVWSPATAARPAAPAPTTTPPSAPAGFARRAAAPDAPASAADDALAPPALDRAPAAPSAPTAAAVASSLATDGATVARSPVTAAAPTSDVVTPRATSSRVGVGKPATKRAATATHAPPAVTPAIAAAPSADGPANATTNAPAPASAEPPATTPATIEALYRRAHDAHFRGHDPAAALAAWDAYLAAEPDGRFAVEARYNRALVLARLRRYREAHAALAPYARGEIAGGYRQAEATALVARLAELARD